MCVTMIHNKCLSSRVTSAEGNLLVSLPNSCWHHKQAEGRGEGEERGWGGVSHCLSTTNIESSSAEQGTPLAI